MTVSELRDLVDEHVAIAGQAARLAAERASAVNVRRLFASHRAAAARATTLGDRIRADSRFHIELAIASQSERLTRREVATAGRGVRSALAAGRPARRRGRGWSPSTMPSRPRSSPRTPTRRAGWPRSTSTASLRRLVTLHLLLSDQDGDHA